MSGPIYYGAELVRRVLTWQLVNDAVEEALKAVAAQSRNAPQLPYVVSQPMRSVTIAGTERSQLLFTMPAYVGNYRLTAAGAAGDAGNATRSTLACKLVTSFRGNQELQPPLPSIAANILLFNAGTGEIDAIMSGTDITTWRTAAASVVATKYLYFGRFNAAISELPIKVAIIGCGTQGEIHAVAMCSNFKVEQLLLYNRTATRAQQLADKLRKMTNLQHTPEIIVCNSARDAVRDANVICVATFSREPLFNACDLGSKRGLHINAVGAGEVAFGEVATDVYQQSEVFVDSLANAEHELKGFPVCIAGEVGNVINKDYKPEPTSMTLFQSMGMASEDACVAEAVRSALLTIDS
ncbi:ketimine reductase mu-crystallin [Drosophila albomicans]|uniref:Ketimine reductase mu-crystallin n=1 Tax=Drosophila albomicans TaxID=7291 RepID=A0A6P8XUT1_DROAB|nr:ketimine reductase mu-crystallin [Drosophila albomicans]